MAIVSRERPYGQTCGTTDLPSATNDCEGNVRYRSFFSGHSAFTFMAAGLICVHHEKLDLLGGGLPDHIACVTAYAGAPPWSGPESAPPADESAAPQSAPVEATTRAVNVEALSPCSAVQIQYVSIAFT